MKKLFFIVCIMLLAASAFADTYYVTQDGDGAPMSAAEFNVLTGDYSGDTFYFSGSFNTRILVKISGTNGNPVVLDGYQGGSCTPLTATCSSSAVLGQGMGVGADGSNNVDYVTVQDFRMTTSSADTVLNLYGGDSNSLDHITIQRNYAYLAYKNLFNVRYAQYLELNGNKFVHYSQGAELVSGGVVFQHTDFVLVTSNEFGHDEDTYPGYSDSTNVVEVHSSNNMLWEYNDIYGTPDQAGVAVKEDATQQYHIWRFNKVHDNELNGLNIGGGTDALNYMYFYGNYLYNNGESGGSSYDTSNYHYWWANIFESNDYEGWLAWDRSQGSPNHIYIYNNTFIKNGDYGSDPDQWNRGGINNQAANNLTAKNNIFWYNRPENNSRYNQVYDARSGTYQYNTYWYPNPPGWTPNLYRGGEVTVASVEGDTGKVADPGMTDPDNGDYTLNGTVVDDGATNLTQCFDVDIDVGGYETVEVCTSWGLDPNNTDWDDKPPTVEVLDRGTYGWDRGAYVYATPTGGGDTTPPTISSATITADGQQIIMTFSEQVTESGSGGDWTLSLTNGNVELSSPSVTLVDVTYDLSRTVIDGEIVTNGLDYTQPGNGIEDLADNDMVSFEDFSVTNNSIVPNPTTYTAVGIAINYDPPEEGENVLAITTAVPSITDETATLTFSSTGAGAIVYSGSCGNGSLANASAGSNTTTWTLTEGAYSGCTITAGTSNTLNVNNFTVTEKYPILFLHGWFGWGTLWNTARSYLVNEGYNTDMIYSPSMPTDNNLLCSTAHPEQVADWVDGILEDWPGFDKVDIVGHSRGGMNLMTALWYDYLDEAKVRYAVTLAGANRFTLLAGTGGCTVGSFPAYPADETPGSVLYSCYWSDSDTLTTLARTTVNDGAYIFNVNNGYSHSDMNSQPLALAQMLLSLQGTNGGNE